MRRSFGLYAIHPTVARDNETDLNGNFDIFTLHPPEVANSHEEETLL